MERAKARKILIEYVKACREDDMPTLEKFEYEEILEAMSMGAEALSTSESSKDLEEAAISHLDSIFGKGKHDDFYIQLFIAGAEWQKSQDESRRMVNIQLANTDTPVDTKMEVAFNDIWRDAEVIVERDGTLDEKATELMKAVCHDFFESGAEWQKEQMMKDYIPKETAKKIARGSLGVQDFIRKIDRYKED